VRIAYQNPGLFIAHSACDDLAHDLNAYADHLRWLDESVARAKYDAQCRRFLGTLGMFAGPFAGHSV
jgi:hypothetical protein